MICNESIKKFFVGGGLYFSIAFVLFIFTVWLYQFMAPPYDPPDYVTYDFFGFPILVWIGNFLIASVGIGWILHGVGFTIIKR